MITDSLEASEAMGKMTEFGQREPSSETISQLPHQEDSEIIVKLAGDSSQQEVMVTQTDEGVTVSTSCKMDQLPTSAETEVNNKKDDMTAEKTDAKIEALERKLGKIKSVPVPQIDSVSNLKSYSVQARHEHSTNIPEKRSHQPRENKSPTEIPSSVVVGTSPISRNKRMKKSIFVSYSPDAGFMERQFVVELVRQLKENNLAEDLWFDKDENNIDSPCWFSLRMEAAEKCRAAMLILSDSYFICPVSVYESKILLERQKLDPLSVKVFSVLFSSVENAEIPKQNLAFISTAVDLSSNEQATKSPAEKTSVVIGAIMEELEKFATINAPPSPFSTPDNEFTGEYKKKKICQWSSSDLQEWLFSMGIKEFYRQVCYVCKHTCDLCIVCICRFVT